MTERQAHPAPTLRASSLVVGRGGLPLSRALDFSVAPGEGIALVGRNGAGKSTLLLTLLGVVRPLAGNVDFQHGEGRAVHYLGHRNAHKGRLSVRENLTFWRDVNGSDGISIEAALAEVGLGALAGLDAGYLSAGQGRRLALARLLVSPRPLWLLDEPTAALDTEGHGLVARLIEGHLDAGGLAVVATHDPLLPERLVPLQVGARP
jgi:heme exporter protein A